MKDSSCDDLYLQSAQNDGLLQLELNESQQFLTEINTFVSQNSFVTELLPEITNIENVTQGIELLNVLLENISTTDRSDSNDISLIQCLKILQSTNILCSKELAEKLTVILSKNYYSEHMNDICRIITTSKYKPTEEQITQLTPLLSDDNSMCIIDLFIAQ